MNPLNYLHLPRSEVDIRGSQIAMYFLFNPDDKVCSTIVFNFQDGRWSRVVEEPILRVKEALQESCKNGSGRDPFYVQAVFLTSALRWWNNALNSFNDQLIAYVNAQEPRVQLKLRACTGRKASRPGGTVQRNRNPSQL